MMDGYDTIEAPPERPVTMEPKEAALLRRAWRKHPPVNGDMLVKVDGVWWLVPRGVVPFNGLFDREIEE